MDKGLKEVSSKKKQIRKMQARLFRIFPTSWGMRMDAYIDKMAHELNYEYSTVETYLKSGFSEEKTCDEICVAVQNIYRHFISDEKNDVAVRNHAKKVQESLGDLIFESIQICEKAISIVESGKPFSTEKHRRFLTANLFMSGDWPENGEVLTREELDWLRESLLQFPPKDIKICK